MDQMTIIFAVGGLLALTLILASVAHRYHAFVEERRQHVQRILKRVAEIDGLIRRMVGLPIPVELERVLRRDIIARLHAVKGVHARYKGINEMIAQAQHALEQVVASPASGPMSEQNVERFSRLIGEIEWLLNEDRLLVAIDDQEKGQLLEMIVARRTETLYSYHLREGKRLLEGRQLHQAQWHCEQVKSLLKNMDMQSDQLNAWRQEADQLCQQVAQHLS
ncbi:MAG: hypothetical protein B6D78_07980 [gamma proteobacterium symbiont of Ctena orbiculata]|nr:MAG: hypothetical protein B6D78_07980 [gamma proteobacterium symbiont of Ctena orbiculata]